MRSVQKGISVLLALALIGLAGCDVGINALLFDGSPLTASLRIDSPITTIPPQVETVNMNEVLEAIDEIVDSIDVFNITLIIDSTENNAATVLNGTSSINGIPLVTMSNVSIAEFAAERSIFKKPLMAGLTVTPEGIRELRRALNNRSLTPEAVFTFSGSANSSPIHCTIRVKIYTQVYTSP